MKSLSACGFAGETQKGSGYSLFKHSHEMTPPPSTHSNKNRDREEQMIPHSLVQHKSNHERGERHPSGGTGELNCAWPG